MKRINKKISEFTLIELLIVIAIIAMLVGLLLPAIAFVRDNAKNTKARAMISSIHAACKQYETTYGLLPIKVTEAEDRYCDSANFNQLIEVLSCVKKGGAISDYRNVRKIKFLNVTPAYTKGTDDYVDPWGKPFKVTMDHNYDGSVSIPSNLNGSVFIWSLGKNKTDENGDGDDINSWQ